MRHFTPGEEEEEEFTHFRMWFTSEWWFHHKTDKYTINLTCFKQQKPPQNTCFKQQHLEPKTSFYPFNFYLERIWLTGFSESWLETMNMTYMTIQSINDLYGLRGLAIRFAQGGHPRSSEVIRSDVKIWKITMLLMGKSTIYYNSIGKWSLFTIVMMINHW